MPSPKDPVKYLTWKRRMSESKKGIPSHRKGKKHKAESIEKMRIAHMGNLSWCKGLTKETDERLKKAGEVQSETKKNGVRRREARINIWFTKLEQRITRKQYNAIIQSEKYLKTGGPFYGKHHSEKTKQLLREKKLGKTITYTGIALQNKINACKNRIWTEEMSNKIREKRKNWKIPYEDTKPERMMQIALSLNGLKYEKHRPFKLGKYWHQVDIFIKPNIIVEVDGVHWHLEEKDFKRDLFQTQELTILGYHVIRIRDKDILQNTQNCAEKVIKLIKELNYRYPLHG